MSGPPQLPQQALVRALVTEWQQKFAALCQPAEGEGGADALPASARARKTQQTLEEFVAQHLRPKARSHLMGQLLTAHAHNKLWPAAVPVVEKFLAAATEIVLQDFVRLYNVDVKKAPEEFSAHKRRRTIHRLEYLCKLPQVGEHAAFRLRSFAAFLQGAEAPSLPDTPTLRQLVGRLGDALVPAQKYGLAHRTLPLAPERGASTHISLLMPQDGPAYFVASTLKAGGFTKFKPVLTADGRLLAARMMRTAFKAPNAQTGRRATRPSTARTVARETEALLAVQSPLRPQATLVDQKGRIYQMVQMADGSAAELTAWLSPAQRRAALPLFLQDTLRDLCALEDAGYLHRDLKPANVVFLHDGHFLLADYGLAEPMQGADGANGTFPMQAPEIYWQDPTERAAALDKSDVYGLALTALAFLLGGQLPVNFVLGLDTGTSDSTLDPSLGAAADTSQFTSWALDTQGNLTLALGVRGWGEGSGSGTAPTTREARRAQAVQQDYRAWQTLRAQNAPRPYAHAGIEQLQGLYDVVADLHPQLAHTLFDRMLQPSPTRRASANEAMTALAPAWAALTPVRAAGAVAAQAADMPALAARRQVFDAMRDVSRAFAAQTGGRSYGSPYPGQKTGI